VGVDLICSPRGSARRRSPRWDSAAEKDSNLQFARGIVIPIPSPRHASPLEVALGNPQPWARAKASPLVLEHQRPTGARHPTGLTLLERVRERARVGKTRRDFWLRLLASSIAYSWKRNI
jgi:hypothetical protein